MSHVLRVLFSIQLKYIEEIRLKIWVEIFRWNLSRCFSMATCVLFSHFWLERFILPVNGYEISHKIAGTAVKAKYQPQRSALPIILGSAIICPTEMFALKFFKGATSRSYLNWWQALMSVMFSYVGDKWPIIGVGIVYY